MADPNPSELEPTVEALRQRVAEALNWVSRGEPCRQPALDALDTLVRRLGELEGNRQHVDAIWGLAEGYGYVRRSAEPAPAFLRRRLAEQEQQLAALRDLNARLVSDLSGYMENDDYGCCCCADPEGGRCLYCTAEYDIDAARQQEQDDG